MGFTTTFLALGEQANRLHRGERVCLVIKTRYKARAVLHTSTPSETTKAAKKKAQKAPKGQEQAKEKKPKAPSKKKKAASAKDDVEDLSDDFDDVVEIIPPPNQYPLIPVAKSAGRYVCDLQEWFVMVHCSPDLCGLLVHPEFLKATSRRWRNCSRIGEQAFVTTSTSCRITFCQRQVLRRSRMLFP